MPNAHYFPRRHLAHVLRSSSNLRPSYFLVKQPNTVMSRIIHTSASLKSANALPISTLQGKVDSSLMEGLDGMGFEYMTPVQSQVMNGLPTFRSDCLVQAKTGTGKTIAFLLPAIQTLLTNSPPLGQVSILILSPTRELAIQIAEEAKQLVAKFRRPVQVHTAFGGSARATNLKKFVTGDPKILVATPGRLNDYLSEQQVRAKFESLQTLILDEADAMLEAGFLPDILTILRALPPKKKAGWQGMCFSATLPPKIKQVLSNVLNEEYTTISTVDSSEPPTLSRVPQFSVIIPSVKHTFTTLYSLLKTEIASTTGDPKIIVFGATSNLVALYAKLFEGKTALNTYELHSRLSQPRRTRVTSEFKNANSGVMFATDVIGRGMDFPNVTLVVQAGLPPDSDAYTHRVGRTARAGKDGRAVILLTRDESFFIDVNRQFPITSHSASDDILKDPDSRTTISHAFQSIDQDTKQKAYSSYLGVMKGFMNKLKIKPEGLVRIANELALEGMNCQELPEMTRKTIGKMGLKGVSGIRLAPKESAADDHNAKRTSTLSIEKHGRSRRLKHQGLPGI